MSTSKLAVREGKFVVYDWKYDPNEGSVPVERLDTFIENINGWTCFVSHSGKIICECEREYSDGLNTIRYVIKPNGFGSLVFVDPSGRKEIRKQGFVVPKHRRGLPISGMIGLSGGNVTERYAYFRDAEFQAFLDKFGITAIKRENPNQRFSAPSIYCGGGSASSELWTDGSVTENYEDDEWFLEALKEPGSNQNLYHGRSSYMVSGAKWTVMDTAMNYRDSHNAARILYTKVRDATTLENDLTKHGVMSNINRG